MRKIVFGKIVALVLCTVMALSVTSTASAAGIEVHTQDFVECKTMSATLNSFLGSGEIINIYNSEKTTLKPFSATTLYIGELTAGQTVRISAIWTPMYLDLNIGLIRIGINEPLFNATDGSVDFIAEVSRSGEYFLLLINPSQTTFTDVSLTVTVYNPE